MSVVKEKMNNSNNKINGENIVDFEKEFNNKNLVKVKEASMEEFEKSSKNPLIVISLVFLAIIIILLTTIICYNIFYKKNFSNIYIDGLDVSNLTKEETFEKVKSMVMPNLEREIILKNDSYEKKITPIQIGAEYNIKQAVEEAYRIGRGGDILENNINMIKSFFYDSNINLKLSYDSQKLDEYIEEMNKDFSDLKESSYEILEDKIIIKKGEQGKELKQDVLKQQIISNIENKGNDIIEFGIIVKEPTEINLDELHKKIYKAPVNAYYTTDPFKVYESENGLDFSMTLEEAKAYLGTEKEEYVIGLKELYPEVTTAQIGTEAFPDLLATCTTTYITSKIGRTNNLKIASGKVDGYVVMPGQTFSYNEVVGERTAEAGFQLAGVYSNGQVVDGIGGGICQISSTLYNIVVMSNLEIVERENHTFLPGYLPAGRDATVVYGAIDFKFKNTRDYPVKIMSSVGGGYVTMKMFGLKTEDEPEISFETVYHKTLYPQTVYQDTTSLSPGKTKVSSSGQNGCTSTTYKVEKRNGKVVSKTVLSNDTYKAMNKIVLRGVKK